MKKEDCHIVITTWKHCKVIKEQRFDYQEEKVEEFYRLAHILQVMVAEKGRVHND